ncbi:hypothetical protein KUA24_117 [Vibrio phage HNL01]|nr:hypothetical protein KUA24_117 [Vibrio phage HNL01]
MTIKKLEAQDFIDMQTKVLHFNTVMGNSVEDKSLIPTYQSLCLEELTGEGELIGSLDKGDMEGVCDGISDLVFTAFMYASLKGVNLKVEREWLDRLCTEGVVEDIPLEAYAQHMLAEVENGYARAAQRWLIMMMVQHQDKFDFSGAVSEVYDSNMSKFIPVYKMTGEGAEFECSLIEGNGRYGTVFFETVSANGEEYYSFRALQDKANGVTFSGSGKLIKVEGYFIEPELEKFVLV